MKLSDLKIRSLHPGPRPYKVSDGGGLNLLVTPAGGRLWRLAYRYGGKQKELAFGAYPAVPLRRARELRDEAKAMLAGGQDPAEIRKQEKRRIRDREANTLESVGRAWYRAQLPRWSPRHQKEVLKKLENDVYPVLGDRPIADIEPPELLSAIRRIEARGAIHLAKKTMRLCGQIFRYAVAHGLAARDPSQDLRGALKASPPTRHLAALKAAELPAFLQALSRYDGERSTALALRLIVLTFVRTSELRFARWSEIEGLDGERPLWRISAERMKMRSEHLVPLAPQAVEIFRELAAERWPESDLIFPAHTVSSVISENTLIYAMYRLGYKSRATVHGFRSTASTILNEHGFNRDWIERQLAHGERDEVRAAYNAAQWLNDRQEMMVWWADYLDDALTKGRRQRRVALMEEAAELIG